jgi:hypothetical protein
MIITITIKKVKKFTEEDGSFTFKNIKFICTKRILLHLQKSRGHDFTFKPQRWRSSERHQKIFKKEYAVERTTADEEALPQTSSFTDIDFDDI